MGDKLERAREVFETDTSPLMVQLRAAAGSDPYFGLWLLKADGLLRARAGLNLFDLDGAWPWRSAYGAGEHPGAAVQRALRDHPKWGMLVMEAPE